MRKRLYEIVTASASDDRVSAGYDAFMVVLIVVSLVPLGTINKILSGDTQEPKLPAFMALASALNTSVDYLVYGRSDTRSPVLTASEVSLLDDFRDASDEIREEAAAMLHRSAERNRKDALSSTSEAG